MFALRACLEITAIFCAAEKKNWLLFAAIFLSKRKKNLAGALSGKVLAEKPGFEPGRHSRTLLP